MTATESTVGSDGWAAFAEVTFRLCAGTLSSVLPMKNNVCSRDGASWEFIKVWETCECYVLLNRLIGVFFSVL